MAVYTVKKKPLSPNTVWDAETEKPLCRFEKGTFVTDDERTAKKLEAMGHSVTRMGGEADMDGQKPDFKAGEGSSNGESTADAGTIAENGENQPQYAEDEADTDTGETKKTAGSRNRK